MFLPTGGSRNGTTVGYEGTGYYWSASVDGSDAIYSIEIIEGGLNIFGDNPKGGNSVRLVCQTNPRIRTIGVSNMTTTSATVSAEVDYTGSAGNRYICWNTTGSPTVYNSNTISGGLGTGSFSSMITSLQPNTTYYVRACSYINDALRYGNELTFTTPDDGCNGHAYVDLGLPSGLLWATCNVGATTPEDYGDYFAWGETQPKDTYTWDTYKYCSGSIFTQTKYCTDAEDGNNDYVDNMIILLHEDDAATTNWGEGWRMPTEEEFQELYNNTTVTWTQQNGVNGRLFTASNGNSLFLPAAGCLANGNLYGAGSRGYYWSSSLLTDYSYQAWSLYLNSGDCEVSWDMRYSGQSVRPVRSSRQN